ncbi:cysteine desulfurase-like protein [Brevibacillus sp. SYSU BS000544]|uniref:cysteine desulfurase-like protein n=1 Tax=Brevibacillus sp. SYSU BS000544 TaxID=3416443 RepID=UPI003CE582BA
MSLERTFDSQAFVERRADFPSLARTVSGYPAAYFDGPGGTQVPRQVIQAISAYYETSNANAHGPFITSQETDMVVDRTREAMAALLGAETAESISFGANMTTLAFSLKRALARVLKPGDEVIITDLDHEANRGPWLSLEEHGAVVRSIPMTSGGTIEMQQLHAALSSRTRIVAVGYSSNSLGTVNDLETIRKWTREVGAWLIVDAVHYAPHFPMNVAALDPDFLLCSAYKFYGPHVGILYCKPGLLNQLPTDKLRPQLSEAPYRIETGTLNFAALAGVTAAVEYIASFGKGSTLQEQLTSGMNKIHAYETFLAHHLYNKLCTIDGVIVYGQPFDSDLRAPTISFVVDGIASPKVAETLGDQGIFVWGGHFYAMQVIESLGLQEQHGLVRVGISLYNTLDEVDRLIEAVQAIASKGVARHA